MHVNQNVQRMKDVLNTKDIIGINDQEHEQWLKVVKLPILGVGECCKMQYSFDFDLIFMPSFAFVHRKQFHSQFTPNYSWKHVMLSVIQSFLSFSMQQTHTVCCGGTARPVWNDSAPAVKKTLKSQNCLEGVVRAL